MGAHLVRLQPKRIMYRSYKNFNESLFLEDIQNTDFNCDIESFVQKFKKIVDKHAPLKQKTLLGNQAPFMNKNLRKAICTRSRLKNNFCVNLREKSYKRALKKITEIVENKTFWQTVFYNKQRWA